MSYNKIQGSIIPPSEIPYYPPLWINGDSGKNIVICSDTDETGFESKIEEMKNRFLIPVKEFCPYCHGKTESDARGNCGACGAPRGE